MSENTPLEPQAAFEQLARITLADQTLSSVMDKVAQLAKRAVPGAAEVSVTLVDDASAAFEASAGNSGRELRDVARAVVHEVSASPRRSG